MLALLAAMGLDPQLLTAGSAGGLVKAVFDKSSVLDSIQSMLASAFTANYASGLAVKAAASGAIFSFQVEIGPNVAAFFVGLLAAPLFGVLMARLRTKLEERANP